MLKKTVLLLLLIITTFSSCKERHREIYFSGQALGTFYNIKVVAESELKEVDRVKLEQIILSKLKSINDSMSLFKSDSELSRINQHKKINSFKISVPLFKVIELSQQISRKSAGAFDITIAPLTRLYGFGPENTRQIPSEKLIKAAREKIGYDKYTLSQKDLSLKKQVPELEFDLGAVAKGYAVDRISEAISNLGFHNHLVELGGEIRARGFSSKKQSWLVGVEKPLDSKRRIQKTIALSEAAVATSGDYRNFYMENGKRISHLIDPSTGQPVEHNLASVTVISDSTARADAFATTLLILGPEKGNKLAEQEKLPAFFIERNGKKKFKTWSTEAFKKYLAVK